MPAPPSVRTARSQEALSSAYRGPVLRLTPRAPWQVRKAPANRASAPASMSSVMRRRGTVVIVVRSARVLPRPARFARDCLPRALALAPAAPPAAPLAASAVLGAGLAVARGAAVVVIRRGGRRRARIGAERLADLLRAHDRGAAGAAVEATVALARPAR